MNIASVQSTSPYRIILTGDSAPSVYSSSYTITRADGGDSNIFVKYVWAASVYAVHLSLSSPLLRGVRYVVTYTDPQLDLDMTTPSVPTQLAATRASGTIYLAKSGASAASSAPGNTPAYEDRGDGYGGGVWAFGGYSNQIATPFSFTAGDGWLLQNTGTSTNNDGTGPDQTSTAGRVTDTDGANNFYLYQTFTQNGNASSSVWVQDYAGNPPTVSGGFFTNGGVSAATVASFGTGSNWRRIQRFTPVAGPGNVFAIGPAGLAADGTQTGTATGAVRVWGAQTLANNVDVPLVSGTCSNQILQITPQYLSQITTSGSLFVRVSFRQDAKDVLSVPDGYVWAADSLDGQHSVRYTSSTETWGLYRAGSLLCSTTMGVPAYGSEVTVYTEIDTTHNTSMIRIACNGAVQNQSIGIGTANGTAKLSALSSFYLGSNAGTANFFSARFTRVQTFLASQPFLPEILIIGDSIASWTIVSTLTNAVFAASAIYTIGEARTRPGIISIAFPGDTCQTQQTKFNTFFAGMTSAQKSAIKCVLDMTGINNVAGANESGATALSNKQSLITTVKAALPNVKYIVTKLTPAKTYLNALGGAGSHYTAWQNYNAGVGALTGVDAVCTACSDNMNNGSDDMFTSDDFGDGIHPNTYGRVNHMAPGWRASIRAAGIF